jgi:hypothetical protein
VWPGAAWETSAANAAVIAAAPPISQRRVLPIRSSAASRCNAASDRVLEWCCSAMQAVFSQAISFL